MPTVDYEEKYHKSIIPICFLDYDWSCCINLKPGTLHLALRCDPSGGFLSLMLGDDDDLELDYGMLTDQTPEEVERIYKEIVALFSNRVVFTHEELSRICLKYGFESQGPYFYRADYGVGRRDHIEALLDTIETIIGALRRSENGSWSRANFPLLVDAITHLGYGSEQELADRVRVDMDTWTRWRAGTSTPMRPFMMTVLDSFQDLIENDWRNK